MRATYTLHDRVLSNRSSRRHFAGSAPELDDVQQRIVSELSTEGYCVVPFSELIPDPAAWTAIEEQADAFVAETEAALAGDREGLRVRAGKEFVVRLYSYGVEIGLDDPWFAACASHRMLDIANTYLGLWSKLEYVDMWYSVPQPADADRKASQRWHRDFNDKHLLKAFLYLVDVDAGTGPFEYVPGSAPGRAHADAWPWRPLGENYPPDGELEKRIPSDGIRTFTAPKGTMVFCNTAGFHRGGFATERAARARDGDVLVAGVARVPDGAQLPLHRVARRAGRSHEVRGHLNVLARPKVAGQSDRSSTARAPRGVSSAARRDSREPIRPRDVGRVGSPTIEGPGHRRTEGWNELASPLPLRAPGRPDRASQGGAVLHQVLRTGRRVGTEHSSRSGRTSALDAGGSECRQPSARQPPHACSTHDRRSASTRSIRR